MPNTETSLAVPPLNLADNFRPLRSEILAAISEVCDSGYYVLGPKVEAFEQAFAEHCGAKYALGVSSGTDALLAALMSLGIGPRDEVIVPAFTFFATAGVVERVGARPVFVDIEPETFNLDVEQLERTLTVATKAVIPVHLYGQMADLRGIFKVVNRHGLHVIEDAAQAVGAAHPDFPDRLAGAMGAYGAISFYPTKNLGAIGDAGALLTNDEKLYQRAKQCRLHGETAKYHHAFVGGNFRIDPLQAAILTVKLAHLSEWNAKRAALAERYTALIEDRDLAPEFVQPPKVAASSEGAGGKETRGLRHVYHQYVIRARRRDELIEHLHERKIGAAIYYPVPLHLQACFEHLGYKPGDFPHAERAAAEVLALPVYPELSDAQQEAVVGAIAAFYKR